MVQRNGSSGVEDITGLLIYDDFYSLKINLHSFQDMLHQENPFIQTFIQAREYAANAPTLNITLHLKVDASKLGKFNAAE
jgi:hypothetical protein